MEHFDKVNGLEKFLEIFVKRLYGLPPFKTKYLLGGNISLMVKSVLVPLRTYVCLELNTSRTVLSKIINLKMN